MDFPQQTKELTARVASEIREKNGDDPLERARGAYNYLHGKFGYGFREGLEQGRFIRWPHEIKREWECIEAATYVYALAEGLGLHPRMMSVQNWQDIDTGHETVDVQVNGRRVVIDPLNSMFGEVTYWDDGIVVSNNDTTERCVLPCSWPREVPRDELIARVDYYRTDEGFLNLLSSGQSLPTKSPVHNVFVHYDPRTQVVTFQLRAQEPFIDPHYYSERVHLSREGPKKVIIEQGIYQISGWIDLIDAEPFWRITSFADEERERVTTKFPFKKFGYLHVLTTALYHEVLERKFPEFREDGTSEGRFLFDYRERPLEVLAEKIDELERQGITPARKAEYADLRRAYIKVVELDHTHHEVIQRPLDFATLRMHINDIAKTEGVSPIAVHRRMFQTIGIGRDEMKRKLDGRRVWDSFGKSVDKVFPTEIICGVFDRLVEKGLLR